MKSVAIVFGRLNPPTTGHLKLIEALDSQPADDKILFLSHSMDPVKNPLSYSQKVYFAKKLFGSRFPQIKIEDTQYTTLIEVMQSLSAYDEVILLAGSDRVPAFQQLLDKYNGRPDKAGNILYSFTSIQVESAGDRDPDAEDVTGMSASKMRALAKAGDFEGFRLGVPTEDDSLAEELFVAVRRGMKLIEARMRMRSSLTQLEEAPVISKAQQAKLRNLQQKNSTSTSSSASQSQPSPQPDKTTTDRKNKQDSKPASKAADQIKAAADKKQAEEDAKGVSALSNFMDRLKAVPADGGLSKSPTDYSKARAQVLIVLADPVTRYHAAVIDQFIRSPARVIRGTSIPQGTPAYKVVVIASSKSDIVDKPGVRALWIKDLVGSTKNAYVLFGKVEAVTRTLAGRFGYMEFTAQERVRNKTSSLIVAEWNRIKGTSQTTAFAVSLGSLGVTTSAFDDPNSAQEALATTDKQLITDLSAFKKRVQDSDNVGTELEKQIAAVSDKRKRAFLEELPRGKNLQYLEAVYYVFCALYKKKAGKSVWDLFKSVFASEIQAVSELGEELGITQGVRAAGKIRSFLKSRDTGNAANGAADSSTI